MSKFLVLPSKDGQSEETLAVIDRAAQLITKAKTLDETRMLKTLFDFAQRQARQRKLEGMEKDIIAYQFMLMDKTGELIEQKKEAGEISVGRPKENASNLAAFHISQKESSESQKFHKLPEPEKQKLVEKEQAKVGVKRTRRTIIESPQPPVFTTGSGKPIETEHVHLFNRCACGAMEGTV